MVLSIISLGISVVSLVVSIATMKKADNPRKEIVRKFNINVEEFIDHLSKGLEESLLEVADSFEKKP